MSQTQTGTSSSFLPHKSVDPHKNRNGNPILLIVTISSLATYFCQLSDAQRPCSTCVRSHAHALSHASAGVNIPERPECTFDDGIFSIASFPACGPPSYASLIVPSTAVAQEVPKNRYEKLENRISSYLSALSQYTIILSVTFLSR